MVLYHLMLEQQLILILFEGHHAILPRSCTESDMGINVASEILISGVAILITVIKWLGSTLSFLKRPEFGQPR